MTKPIVDKTSGRGYLWAGIGLALVAIILVAVQFGLKQLIVPWYFPAVTTLGAVLLLCSVARRVTVVRILALGLIGAMAGCEWYFLTSLAKLPEYHGPAQAGKTLPSFATTLADGQAFSDQDLRDGTRRVLTFFRGRW